MSTSIQTLRDVWNALTAGTPITEALTAYYASKDNRYLAAELKQCGQIVALCEERNRPNLVATQRLRLGIIAAEIEKRQEATA